MKYLKIILTVISVLLALNLVKPLLIPHAVGSGIMDVNVVKVGGYYAGSGVLRVAIVE